jgi:transcriptional regulator with XRE-family HTH domain
MEKVVGNALRKEREARGVSLSDIARETRIGTRFLQALEDEDFSVFPGKFYVHYYIKNYLHACGADDTTFFNTFQPYLKSMLKDGDGLTPDQYLHKMAYVKFRRSQKILLALALLAGLAVLATLLFGPMRLLDKLSGSGAAAGGPVPAFSAHLLRAGNEYCLDEVPLTAILAFDSSCWARLLRGTEKMAERVFHRGDTFSLQGYRLTLIIEKPQAVRLRLNGRDVSFLRKADEAVKLVVDPGNLQEILER